MTQEKSTTVHINVRISESFAAATKLYAEENDRSVSWVIRKALEEFLQKKGYSVRAS